MVSALFLFLVAPVGHARSGGDVYWHTSPDVKSCSMVIDASLTQSQWNRFTRQAGAVVSFKSLGPAETLGKKHFKVAIDASNTPVDQHDLAWINTFTHPSSRYCPLGDAVKVPTIRAEMGVSDNMDVGGFWTTAPNANYGLVGADVKYAFLQHSGKLPAVAARASATILTGVPDFNMGIYSLDLMTSKNISALTPYVGIKESVAVGTETTTKVNLDRATESIAQGFAGAVYSVWKLNLAAEYNVSYVNTLTLAAGFRF